MKRSWVVALRLAKEGFMNGNPNEILRAPTETVLAMAEYTGFLAAYQDAAVELNK